MDIRIKEIGSKNGIKYAVQIKRFIFWKTLVIKDSFSLAQQEVTSLIEMEKFNNNVCGKNKISYNLWAVRNVSKMGPYPSINMFESKPIMVPQSDGGVMWRDERALYGGLITVFGKNKFLGKDFIEPTKLRITIEEIE
jgi:hypothetical protein